MNLNVKMSTKIGAAFLILTVLVLVCGIAGYYGVNRLSQSLEYVTGPAWDSADGAMEASIGTQGEMLVIEEIFAGNANMATAHEEMKAHADSAAEALHRMTSSGLISEGDVRRVEDAAKDYLAQADRVVAEFKRFAAVDQRLADNFFAFDALMSEAEVLGDGAVEELEKNPNKNISWNTGLEQKWEAADGAMESQIGMLKSMYFYRRMLAFKDAQQSLAGIKEGIDMLTEASEGMIAHSSFKKQRVPEGEYKGQTFSSALTQAVSKHKNDFAEASEIFKTYAAAREDYEETSIKMLEILEKNEEVGDATVEAEMDTIGGVIDIANNLIVIVVIVAMIISIFMALMILRGVNTQLGRDPAELMTISESLANGDLDIKVDKGAVGVYGSIGQTIQKLLEIISGIKSGASEVSVASEQVSQGNANLSQRTQEQASSLEEVASSMEEMTGTVNQNSENAQHANQLAIAAREQADTGGRVVNEAITAMGEINDASKQIADIIGVIDEIAFQTNLLALNAAVEAARAGEQGRGFAVVASEVRNLAGRSATAAKEIKDLIQNSVVKVDNGSKLVSESGGALSEIVDSVKKVSDIVAEIAAASKEQSDGINQVNKALLQMDEMTQQNASLVEEAAAASEAMGAQAQELDALVSFFKLNESDYVRYAGVSHAKKQAVTHSAAPKLSKPESGEPAKKISLPHKNKAEDSEWQDF
ncbi:MAG: methyl-accepting chemotaxis protein [Gammaproteobacteria bacterium]|nr:methyl-accepting chemotaxis protein [Gammaproteobacteria bacterium]